MLDTKYNSEKVEEGKYSFWKENGYFESGDLSKKPYCIVIPPPNVTGKLHLGHAWDTALQDIIIRYKRMNGFDALWLPGMDHAAIATEAKVVKKLKDQGIDKYEYGREKFLEACWDWTHEYGGNIRDQWGKVGISVDYNKERFTLDEGLNYAVRKVFVDLYNKGLIYKGLKPVYWCTDCETALAEAEIEYKDINSNTAYVKFPVVDGKGLVKRDNTYVVIWTTTPWTLPGNTMIAVGEDFDYAVVKVGKESLIFAKDLVETVMKKAGIEEYEIKEEFKGCDA